MWILIIIVLGFSNVSTTTVEFTSLDKCGAAAKMLQQDKSVEMSTICVEK